MEEGTIAQRSKLILCEDNYMLHITISWLRSLRLCSAHCLYSFWDTVVVCNLSQILNIGNMYLACQVVRGPPRACDLIFQSMLNAFSALHIFSACSVSWHFLASTERWHRCGRSPPSSFGDWCFVPKHPIGMCRASSSQAANCSDSNRMVPARSTTNRYQLRTRKLKFEYYTTHD